MAKGRDKAKGHIVAKGGDEAKSHDVACGRRPSLGQRPTIVCLYLFPFSLTKYYVILEEVKGDFGIIEMI